MVIVNALILIRQIGCWSIRQDINLQLKFKSLIVIIIIIINYYYYYYYYYYYHHHYCYYNSTYLQLISLKKKRTIPSKHYLEIISFHFIGSCSFRLKKKFISDLRSDTSSVWNFWVPSSLMNQWCLRETSAVFSSLFIAQLIIMQVKEKRLMPWSSFFFFCILFIYFLFTGIVQTTYRSKHTKFSTLF